MVPTPPDAAFKPADPTWQLFQRSQRTIVVVDLVESVRLMARNELDVIDRWIRFVREVTDEVLVPHGGRMVKSLGDGMLLEYAEVLPAVQASFEMHRRIEAYNRSHDVADHMRLRAGAHVADIVFDEADVYGAGVNLTARLTTLARPGDIVVSAEVRDQIMPGLDADIEDLGECFFKHMDAPVRAYRLAQAQTASSQPAGQLPTHKADEHLASGFPTLAVIPFDGGPVGSPMSIMGNLVADDIIQALTRLKSLRVISRLSSRQFQGRSVPAGTLRSALGTDYVLNGSCSGSADQLYLRAELVDVRAGELVWAGATPARTADLLAGAVPALGQMIDEVARAIVAHEVVRATVREPHQLENYTLLLGAISLMHRLSRPHYERSRELLSALIERSPRSAEAYGWLAKWHVLRVTQGWSDDLANDQRRALDASRHALDTDPNCSIALDIDGLVHANLLRRFDVAEQRYTAALQVNPNDSLAWLLKGTLHAFRAEGEQAVADVSHAIKLSPIDPIGYFYESLAATASLSAGRYDDAIALAERSLRANRTHASTLRALAIAQTLSGRIDAAQQTVKLLMQIEPGLTVRGYLERSPGRDYSTGPLWASALAEAGVPR